MRKRESEERMASEPIVQLSPSSRFFFQAEDGIRDLTVTGVQTCALPISSGGRKPKLGIQHTAISNRVKRSLLHVNSRVRFLINFSGFFHRSHACNRVATKIGRASCRERV